MREADADEAGAVRAFFEDLEPGLWSALRAGRRTVVGEEGRVLLMGGAALALPEALRAGASGGLCIGVLGDDGFLLALAGAVDLGFRARVPGLRLTDRGTWMFVRAFDVPGESVARAPPGVEVGDLCLVQAPTGEVVGLGRVVGTFKGKRPAVRSVHDVGAYLREEDREGGAAEEEGGAAAGRGKGKGGQERGAKGGRAGSGRGAGVHRGRGAAGR